MLIKINNAEKKPLYLQITDEIKKHIECGSIETNKPLPSTRILARKIGVHRSTVVRAYEELQALGYLKSRPGSYNLVQKRRRTVDYNPERKSDISWEHVSTRSSRELYKTFLQYFPEQPKLINNKDNSHIPWESV